MIINIFTFVFLRMGCSNSLLTRPESRNLLRKCMSQPGTNLQLNSPRHSQTLPGGKEKKPLDQAGEEMQELFQ
jgi:hypothetical protein